MRACLVGPRLSAFSDLPLSPSAEWHALVPGRSWQRRRGVRIHRFDPEAAAWTVPDPGDYPPPQCFLCGAHTASMAAMLALRQLQQRVGVFDQVIFDASGGWAHCSIQEKRSGGDFLDTSLGVRLTQPPRVPSHSERSGLIALELQRQALRHADEVSTKNKQWMDAYRNAYALDASWGAGRAQQLPASGRVSVVISNYNLGPWLEEAVASARGAKEVIVVDDGSAGDEPVLRRLEQQDVRVIRRASNGGPSAARNDGIAAAAHEYVLLLDGDDVLAPGFMVRAARALDRDRSLAAVVATVGYFDSNEALARRAYLGHTTYLGDALTLGTIENTMGGTTALVRREVLLQTGFDSRLDGVEDWHLWLRLALAGHRFSVTNRVQLYYRQRENSLSRTMLSGDGRARLRQQMLASLPTPLPAAARYVLLKDKSEGPRKMEWLRHFWRQ